MCAVSAGGRRAPPSRHRDPPAGGVAPIPTAPILRNTDRAGSRLPPADPFRGSSMFIPRRQPMSKKPVIVYGASGYTGRLICEALRNYQIPFIAAGRDAKRVEESMKFVP